MDGILEKCGKQECRR